MKLWMKIAIGVIAVFLILTVISKSGDESDQEVDLPDQDTTNNEESAPIETTTPSSEGSELDQIQAGLNNLLININELESEDLGGLEE